MCFIWTSSTLYYTVITTCFASQFCSLPQVQTYLLDPLRHSYHESLYPEKSGVNEYGCRPQLKCDGKR